jgi:hypothetical protein
MGNFKLHGKYGVGFKRWKATNGNDCLVFYPVDKGTSTTPVVPYNNIDKIIEGNKLIGMSPGQAGVIRRRNIMHLCPEAPLHDQF